MTYQEILQALKENRPVYWFNKGYVVKLDKARNRLVAIFKRNEYTTVMRETEYKDCFTA